MSFLSSMRSPQIIYYKTNSEAIPTGLKKMYARLYETKKEAKAPSKKRKEKVEDVKVQKISAFFTKKAKS